MAFFDFLRRKRRNKNQEESPRGRLSLLDQLRTDPQTRAALAQDPSPLAARLRVPARSIPILWAFRAWGQGDLEGFTALSRFQAPWAEEELYAVRALSSETLRYLRQDPDFGALSPWPKERAEEFFQAPSASASGEAQAPEDLALFFAGALGGWARTLLAFAIDEGDSAAAGRLRGILGQIPFSQYDTLGKRFSMHLPYAPRAEALGAIAELCALGLLFSAEARALALHYVEPRLLSEETTEQLGAEEEGLRFPEPLRLGRLARFLGGSQSAPVSDRRRTEVPFALVGRLVELEARQIDDIRSFEEKPDDEVIRSIKDQIWLFDQTGDARIVKEAVRRYLLQGLSFEPSVEDDAVLPRELRRIARAADVMEVIPSDWFNE